MAPGEGARGCRFPPGNRVRQGVDIRRLFRRGTYRKTAHLDVFHAPSTAARCRWGAVVPKHGHTIVERNHLRRRLKEIGRTRALPSLRAAGLDFDVMVRARREAYEASFAQLREELDGVTEALCSGERSSG